MKLVKVVTIYYLFMYHTMNNGGSEDSQHSQFDQSNTKLVVLMVSRAKKDIPVIVQAIKSYKKLKFTEFK